METKPKDKIVRGVKLEAGSVVYADIVVLTTGAWTPSLLGDVQPSVRSLFVATG